MTVESEWKCYFCSVILLSTDVSVFENLRNPDLPRYAHWHQPKQKLPKKGIKTLFLSLWSIRVWAISGAPPRFSGNEERNLLPKNSLKPLSWCVCAMRDVPSGWQSLALGRHFRKLEWKSGSPLYGIWELKMPPTKLTVPRWIPDSRDTDKSALLSFKRDCEPVYPAMRDVPSGIATDFWSWILDFLQVSTKNLRKLKIPR